MRPLIPATLHIFILLTEFKKPSEERPNCDEETRLWNVGKHPTLGFKDKFCGGGDDQKDGGENERPDFFPFQRPVNKGSQYQGIWIMDHVDAFEKFLPPIPELHL